MPSEAVKEPATSGCHTPVVWVLWQVCAPTCSQSNPMIQVPGLFIFLKRKVFVLSNHIPFFLKRVLIMLFFIFEILFTSRNGGHKCTGIKVLPGMDVASITWLEHNMALESVVHISSCFSKPAFLLLARGLTTIPLP